MEEIDDVSDSYPPNRAPLKASHVLELSDDEVDDSDEPEESAEAELG
jgi:hypothetical protein